MKTSSRSRRLLGVSMVLLHLGAAAAFGAGDCRLYEAAGDEAVGYLRVPRPSDFFGRLDTILAPAGFRSRMIMPLIGDRLFQNPTLGGIDLTRPFTVVFLDPERHAKPYAFSLTTTDPRLFIRSVGGDPVQGLRLNPETAASRVKEFVKESFVFDREGYMAALRAGENPDLQDYRHAETIRFYVGNAGRFTVGADDRDLVMRTLKSEGVSPREILEGDLVVHLRPEKLRAMLDRITGDEQPFAAAASFDTGRLRAVLGSMLDQLEAVENALAFGTGRLRLRWGAAARPESPLSQWISRQSPGRSDLMRFVPEESIGVIRSSVRLTGEEWRRILSAFASLENASDEPLKFSGETAAALDAWGEASVGSSLNVLLANPPGSGGFRTLLIYEVKDPERARTALRTLYSDPEILPLITGSMIPPGLTSTYRTNVAQYRGYDIDRFHFSEPENETPASVQAWRTIRTFYGDNPAGYVACIPGYAVVTTGMDGLTTLNQTLSRILENRSTRFTASPRYQSHLARVPSDANIRFWISLGAYVSAVAPALQGAAGTEPDPAALFRDRSLDISGFARFRDAVVQSELVLPVTDLLEIVRSFGLGPSPGAGM